MSGAGHGQGDGHGRAVPPAAPADATRAPLAPLVPCPATPNCISSQAAPDDAQHYQPPLPYRGSRADTERRLRGALATVPRLTRRGAAGDRWHYEARSLVLRFVDDVEFFFNDAAQQVHFRSASRVGRGDFGVNRRRMQRIAAAYARCL